MTGALAAPSPAAAHTDLESSEPAADSSVDTPVSEIVVTFTEAVTPTETGFEVFSPQEELLAPVAETDDDITYTLPLDPPLAGGPVGVRYEVVSADGHVVDGAFAFTVTAPVPTVPPTTPVATPVTTPATSPATTAAAVATTVPPAPATVPPTDPDDGAVATTPTTAPSTTTDPTSVATTIAESSDDDGSSLLWLWIVLGVVVVAGVASWLVVRSRSSA